MKKFLSGAICLFILFSFTACNGFFPAPDSVIIEGVTYRKGFYGSLYPKNFDYTVNDGVVNESYIVNFKKFYRQPYEQYDMVAGGFMGKITYFCAESQWQQAYDYYANADNYDYYYHIGPQFDGVPPTHILNADFERFCELAAFIDTYSYDPYSPKAKMAIRTIPMPDEDIHPQIIFHLTSRDGLFTSFKHPFYVVDGKFIMVYRYIIYDGWNDELTACDVPDELGNYFMGLIDTLTVQAE